MILKVCILASGQIAIPMIEKLHQSKNIVITSLITQPAKPVGRNKKLTHTHVGQWAIKNKFPFQQFANINSDKFLKELEAESPDMLLVFSFGQLLKQDILSFAKKGAINIHGSLLPAYRGASPINACLLDDQKTTGISIIKMAEKLDAGEIYTRKSIPINNNDTYLSLHNKLAQLTSEHIETVLLDIASGKLVPVVQDESLATFTRKITKTDGLINWQNSAHYINRQRKAYFPWPGIYCILAKKRLQITDCFAIDGNDSQPIGKILVNNSEFLVKCGKKSYLKILEILPAGKEKMTIAEFLRGNSFENAVTI